jgi:hypothetical protein
MVLAHTLGASAGTRVEFLTLAKAFRILCVDPTTLFIQERRSPFMKRNLLLVVAVFVLFSLPVLGQEKEKPQEAAPSMVPPSALADDMCAWMIGEWEGWMVSPMGKAKEWDKFEWGLDNQFVIMHATSKTAEMTDDQKKKAMEAYGMSKEDVEKMTEMMYKGMGPITIDPTTGEYIGFWFDNWRGVYRGTGKREGNKVTMTWEGQMGKETRTTEKVDKNTMVISIKSTDPKGNMMEAKTELTRMKAESK